MCMCVCVCVHAHACACMLSCFSGVRLCVTLWTVACQASLSMGFFRHEHWSGLPWPLLGHLPDPRIEPTSVTYAFAGGFFTTSATWEAHGNRSDQISRSVVSDSLGPHESQYARPPCPSPTPRVHSDSCPLSQ